ncbi:hypothetical protein SUGI_0205370 [Cryptomeria japonica]|uniref:eukaryotic translation initiation factor 4B1 n=1 Tax=Cryptomeria japonica TaxID=3369 RepID=UPI002408EB46|nr:eukaryotic translation initiation factor 4B1 [Cryptomeria japonica]GLJ13110.1 hypothetical protein SUGI_0205370 [Cryptomeria japonica]
MAKTAWGAGAWAAESERAEAEKREASLQNLGAGGGGDGADSFPSLGEAVAKTAKQKKKKGQTLSFSEFASGVYVGPGGRSRSGGGAAGVGVASGLTTDERILLPTRPRERSAAEEAEGYGTGRLGGGFRDYGRSREVGQLSNRSSAGGGGQWGSNRRPFDENNDYRKQPMRNEEMDIPSRADEVDNWAVSKKLTPSPLSRPDYVASRADGFDDWGASKKQSNPPSRRVYAATRADEVDDWGAGKKSLSASNAPPYTASRFQAPVDGRGFESQRSEAKPKVNPFGAARPREEVLAEKGQDWRKLDAEYETRSNTSRPTSSHSSRPGSSHSSRPQSPLISLQSPSSRKPKVNPFGDAKPREILLELRGKDYRKMDFELEHKAIDRAETQEEQKLKEEINALKKLAEETVSGESKMNGLDSSESAIQEKITLLEKELELLIRALDDKVRFGKKSGDSRPGSAAGRPFEHLEKLGKKDGDSRPGSAASGGPFDHLQRPWKKDGDSRPGSAASGGPFDHLQRPWKKDGDSRPGSGAGHSFEYIERPGSQSGRFDGSRNSSFELSRSRRGEDRVDVWTRPNEERRGMRMDREMNFPDKNRSISRERW